MSICLRALLSLAVVLAAVGAVAATSSPPRIEGQPMYPPAGLDMSAMDHAVKPGDDFFEYCNGAWLARTEIPPDKPSMTETQAVRDRTEAQLRTLVELSRTRGERERGPVTACSVG